MNSLIRIVATSNGLPVKEITLFALGGVSSDREEPNQRKTRVLDGVVGPEQQEHESHVGDLLEAPRGAQAEPATVNGRENLLELDPTELSQVPEAWVY